MNRAGWAVGLTALLAAAACEAGIVVLKNGEVLTGTLRPAEVSESKLTLHNPRGSGSGQLVIERWRVRWFDVEADTLTDAYFAEHSSEKLLGKRWLDLRDRWVAAQSTISDPVVPDPFILDPLPLDPQPVYGEGFTIRKPRGWSATVEDGILVLRDPGSVDDFPARVHVFSTPSAEDSWEEQVTWIRRELEEVTGAGRFAVVEQHRLQALVVGAHQRLLTETVLPQRTVTTLRQVSFRPTRTVFFAAYADSRSFERYAATLGACLESLELR